MKTALGSSVKVIVAECERPRVRAMFEALGVDERVSPADHVDVFVLGDGANVGFFFVPPNESLNEEQLSGAVWLELCVADLAASRTALDDLSVPRVEYTDKTFTYHRAPGGLVFRLAELG